MLNAEFNMKQILHIVVFFLIFLILEFFVSSKQIYAECYPGAGVQTFPNCDCVGSCVQEACPANPPGPCVGYFTTEFNCSADRCTGQIRQCTSTTCTSGGGNYVPLSCPAGSVLSCGAQGEQYANAACTTQQICDSRYFPSYIGANCGGSNNDCYKNCSCCATGTTRSCVDGGNYVWTTTATRDAFGNWSSEKYCQNNHDDTWISSADPWWPLSCEALRLNEGDTCNFNTTCHKSTCSCVPGGACGGLVPPTNPSIGATTSTTATLNWTDGSGGTLQLIRVGTSQAQVMTGCPGGCLLVASIPLTQRSIGLTNLTPQTTYYWRVVEFLDANNYVDFGNVCLSSTTQQFTTPMTNYLPFVSTFDLKNNLGTVVSWDSGNKNHICKTGFNGSKLVTFNFTLVDLNGASDIQTAQMRWNGGVTNLVLGAPSGITREATATIDYTGVNGVNTLPVYVDITDSQADTGWYDTGYSWKVWNCDVPVSGSIFDGSAGQACNNTGFSTPLAASVVYHDVNNNIDQTTNLVWGNSYLPLVNGGTVGNIDGNLQASGRFTRLIDAGVGTTICPSASQFDVGTNVSAYSTNPSLVVDLSYIKTQENWFSGRGVDIRSKTEIASGVPVTANSALSVDNLAIGISNNGFVATNSFRNTNGWNDSNQYGSPHNWFVNKAVMDNKKYNYQSIYNDYFIKLGEGVTGVTTISTGDTGVLFVNGDLNIENDVVVSANKYLMVVASGKINIGVGASRVDGIYVADSGIGATGDSDNSLVINGVLYTLNNIRLARSYATKSLNNTLPAVIVNYRPDMIFAMPGKLNKVLSGFKEL